MSGDLAQRLYVRVAVKAHGGAGVPEATRQFHGMYALLVPEGGPSMPKRVRTYRAHRAHASRHGATGHSERDASSERFGQERIAVDPSPLTLTFCGFPAEPHTILEHIVGDQAHGLGDAGAELLHRHDGDDETVGNVREDRDNLGGIGRVGFGLDDAWEFDAAVTGDVRDSREVEHLPELTDEETHGAGFVVPLEGGDPGYYLLDVEFVYRGRSKVVVNAFLSRHEPGTRPFGDSTTARYPLVVDRIEATLWSHRSPELHLWVQPGGDPVPDQLEPKVGLPPSSERPAVLEMGVPSPAAVLHVEAPITVRKAPGADVERRHLRPSEYDGRSDARTDAWSDRGQRAAVSTLCCLDRPTPSLAQSGRIVGADSGFARRTRKAGQRVKNVRSHVRGSAPTGRNSRLARPTAPAVAAPISLAQSIALQGLRNLPNVRHACIMAGENMPVCRDVLTSRETVRPTRVAPEPAELCGVAVRHAPTRTSDVRHGCAMGTPAVRVVTPHLQGSGA